MTGVHRVGIVRRGVAFATGAVAALASTWTAWLFFFGGIDTVIFGHAVTSHEPMRPLLITALALTAYVLVGGDGVVTRRARWAARLLARTVDGHGARPLDTVLVVLLAAIALAVGVVDGSKAAGGSDSYGYVSEAELFLQGSLIVHQPWVRDVPWPDATWTFSPLAYKPAQAPADFSLGGYRPSYDPWAIVPTYSPGLPLLMAVAKFIAGNAAMFWIVPLTGAVMILSTYGIGCGLGSPRAGAIAAFFVATSPTLLASHLAIMTDLPVAAMWTLAFWCILGRTLRSAIGAGLALAIAVMIRPNLVPLLPIVAVWVVFRVARAAPERWLHAWRGALVLGGAGLGVLGTAAIFWPAYGSPLESGYGPAAGYFSWTYVLPNLGHYSRWMAEAQTPVIFLGMAAVLVPIRRLWPTVQDRSTLFVFALFVAGVWAEFCLFLVGDGPGYLRFFLPSYPLVMLGLANVVLAIARLSWRGAAPLSAAVALALGLLGVDFAARNGVFHQWRQAAYMDVAAEVRKATPDNSVVLAMVHSGSIRYYGGRMTMRWDNLAPAWLDRAVTWMAERGVPAYVAVEAWELDEMRRRFSGQALAARFDAPAMLRLGDVLLLDLSGSAPPATQTRIIPWAPRRGYAMPPSPLMPLEWKPR